ncbi:chromate efflux transporter [Haloferax sp. S1W]|uniref:chromate efflux transporter n=1 Tax=Haloferax sp. S1W TaxID=3377110 RepID=UPI0037CBBE39
MPKSDGGSTATATFRGDPTPARLVEIVRFFLKLGIVGFGGPLVHIAMMEDELVGDDGWIDQSRFMEGLAICNTLPGPASTQLGILMGWVRAGTLGALAAGAAFMLPTFLLVVGFSYLYFAYGTLPAKEALFYGINPVVIGLIAGASFRMGKSALAEGDIDLTLSILDDEWEIDLRLVVLLAATLAATVVVNPNPLVEFVVAGFVALGFYRRDWLADHARELTIAGVATAFVGALWWFRDRVVDFLLNRSSGESATGIGGVVAGVAAALWANTWVKLFLFMLYTGSFIYGGGLVLIPFIEKYVVTEFGWLTGSQFVDGIAIGQLTPGPVVMTTAFVGYALMLPEGVPTAVLGAFVAMLGAFAPSFLFVTILFPYFARIRDNDVVRSALVGVNAAVVGAILGATVSLAGDAFVTPTTGAPDLFRIVLGITTFALFVRGTSAVRLIIGGALVGAGVYFVF